MSARGPRDVGLRVALLAASTLVAALLLEVAVRALGLDRRIVERALYYQLADPPVHRVSADRFLHYELRPGSAHRTCDAHGCGAVTINALGARGPLRPLARAPGSLRVLFVGGSTTYGAGVDDAQTLPAALERALARGAPPGRAVEVWNHGTSAYTLAQVAWLARHKLDALRPDVVVVQLYNRGRRAFLPFPAGASGGALPWLRDDAELIPENFPAPDSVGPSLHARAMRALALYRVAQAWRRRSGSPSESAYGDAMSRREAAALTAAARARGVEVLYVAIPAVRGSLRPRDVFPGLPDERFLDLYVPGREATFYEVHPPASYLAGYAEQIAATLRARGLVPPAGQ